MKNETTASVHLTKRFSAGRDKLYKAWTEEQQLKQWWRPLNKKLTRVENDIRQGGNVAYYFEDNLQVQGEYKEVAEGEKLVYSWIWDFPDESMHKGEYLLTVQFMEDDDGSSLEITQENFKEEHSIKPHEEGWNEALEELKKYLESKK